MKNDPPSPHSVYLSQLMLKKSHLSPVKYVHLTKYFLGLSLTIVKPHSAYSWKYCDGDFSYYVQKKRQNVMCRTNKLESIFVSMFPTHFILLNCLAVVGNSLSRV